MNTRTFLSPLVEQSQEQDSHEADVVCPANFLKFKLGQVIAPPNFLNVGPLSFTEWSLTQLCKKLGPVVYGEGTSKSVPVDFMGSVTTDVFDYTMNSLVQNVDKPWMIRGYDDNCRAILDGKYPTVSNTDILQALDTAITESNPKGIRLAESGVYPDVLSVKTIWKDDTQKGYGIGACVRNGEIGNRKVAVLPLIKIHSCDNSIVTNVDAFSFEHVHRGSTSSLLYGLRAAIASVFGMAKEVADRYFSAFLTPINLMAELDAVMGTDIQDEFRDLILLGTKGSQTMGGLVNGITYAAQSIEDQDLRVDMEMLAGNYLLRNRVLAEI